MHLQPGIQILVFLPAVHEDSGCYHAVIECDRVEVVRRYRLNADLVGDSVRIDSLYVWLQHDSASSAVMLDDL